MMTGKVTSITQDWRGDTLMSAVSSGSVLTVADTVDFDEDGGWLVVADSAPLEYVAVDEDTATVTLAAPVPAAYEEGVPVVLWDPTVADGGAAVVEYIANIDLSNDGGVVAAILPHVLIPTAGTDFLIGATVVLDDVEDAPTVAQVLGREAVLDRGNLRTALVSLTLPANQTIPDTTITTISGWGGTAGTVSGGFYKKKVNDITVRGGADGVDLTVPGVYLIVATVDWASNSSGGRTSNLSILRGGVEVDATQTAGPPASGGRSTQQVTRLFVSQGDETVKVTVVQSSGAALDVRTGLSSLQVFQVAV